MEDLIKFALDNKLEIHIIPRLDMAAVEVTFQNAFEENKSIGRKSTMITGELLKYAEPAVYKMACDDLMLKSKRLLVK